MNVGKLFQILGAQYVCVSHAIREGKPDQRKLMTTILMTV